MLVLKMLNIKCFTVIIITLIEYCYFVLLLNLVLKKLGKSI